MEKKKIIVSACLLGVKCRFDGLGKENKSILDLKEKYDFIPVCPEILGGLPTPRVSSEIKLGKVINKEGIDVTDNYMRGALETLKICKVFDVNTAVLKSKSPSCGKGKVYDGTFSGSLVDGNGITTQLLIDNGINVYTEDEFIEKYY